MRDLMSLQCHVDTLEGRPPTGLDSLQILQLTGISYAIPGENGAFETGKRFINYVWYDNCPAGSKDLKENLTDTDGHTHRNTLPMGKMSSEVWHKQKAYAAQVMTPYFLELVNKTTLPFVSTIRDCSSTHASFLDGKILFVGEALTLMRPHTGMSFNHSAVNCMTLRKVLQGELTLREWESEVLQWAEWNTALATAVGSYYLRHVWSPIFILSVVKVFFVLLRQRFLRLLHPLRARL